jgi:hypothetical protein
MHTQHIGGFLHRIGEPLDWWCGGWIFVFWDGFHTSP